MSKQRIIDYVMNTPGNTNPNVLNSLLDEEMNNLPPIGPEDKNKYLHTNESTGALEWAGGGVLVVHATAQTVADETIVTLNKTWQEIADADFAVIKSNSEAGTVYDYISDAKEDAGIYLVDTRSRMQYVCDSASDYPFYVDGK